MLLLLRLGHCARNDMDQNATVCWSKEPGRVRGEATRGCSRPVPRQDLAYGCHDNAWQTESALCLIDRGFSEQAKGFGRPEIMPSQPRDAESKAARKRSSLKDMKRCLLGFFEQWSAGECNAARPVTRRSRTAWRHPYR